ncbi:MAG TPA: molybdopterin-dependent oxidoreductase, partial [Lacipirellulaceae bacterium]|nr:molybdopterin-dependent oxidoreductase [Lacipirellulaceae bacterium]
MAGQTRTPSFCVQCRSRCGCTAVTENGVLVGIEASPSHPSGLKLCPKGQASPELVYHPDRLTTPLLRKSPKGSSKVEWEPMTWRDAIANIAERMNHIRAAHGAEQVAFSVTTPSGTQISDGISWIERFVRAYGSPNTIYATEICNWHKDFASRFTYGTDIGTPDFANTDCVLLWGNNPAATWLARSVEIQKAIKRGAKLVVVDPKPTLYARRADAWLRVRPGTDQALALGLANALIARGSYDRRFMQDWSNGPLLIRLDTGLFLREADLQTGGRPNVVLAAAKGPNALLRYDMVAGAWLDDPSDVELDAAGSVQSASGKLEYKSAFSIYAAAAAQYPLDRVSYLTGVTREDLNRATDVLASSASVAYYAWNGIGQSSTATQTDRAVSLLYGLTGSYGAAGGNVPGGAAAFTDISGMDLLGGAQRKKALGFDQRPLGPPSQGWVTARDVYRAVLDGTPYPIRMLFSFGTNLLASQPDTDLCRAALSKLDFHVHADLFLNASARYADIVLPVSSSWEREALRLGFDCSLDGLRLVQLRPAAIKPIGQARSDTEIVLSLGSELGLADKLFGCDVDRGHDHMLAPSGLTVAKLRAQPEGITVPGTAT